MTLFFLLGAGIAYFLNAYSIAFALIAFSMMEQILVILRAIADPTWYIDRRIKANQHVDLFRPGKHVIGLIITKVLWLWVLGFFAYHVSRDAGLL